MKKYLVLSAFCLFGCIMFALGLFSGLLRYQLFLLFGIASFIGFLISYTYVIALAIAPDAFTTKQETKKLAPVSRTLDSIFMRDKIAEARYRRMMEDDTEVPISQSDFDRHYLVHTVRQLIDTLLEQNPTHH